MIKAVFFDLFNTLVHYDPIPEDHHAQACRNCGIEAESEGLRRGYWAANDFFSRENARSSFDKRPAAEQQAVWLEYEATLLREAGVNVSRETMARILEELRQIKQKTTLFEDALPTLKMLRSRGLTVGLISNLNKGLNEFCCEIGLTAHLDFALSSHDVGFDKPHPEIFRTALKRAAVQAAEAIHVGDQYHSDVIGARSAGIKPLLLDRDGFFNQYTDCQRISKLQDIIAYL